MIHTLLADVQMGAMRCNISENYTIFCQCVDHKCYYELNIFDDKL